MLLDNFSAIFKSKPKPVPSESIDVTIISPAPLNSTSFAQSISSLLVSSLPKSFLQIYFSFDFTTSSEITNVEDPYFFTILSIIEGLSKAAVFKKILSVC